VLATSPEAVADHIRQVHGDGAAERDMAGADLAEFLLDRLHGCAELPPASEGRCKDCKEPRRRVWMGGLQLCRPCGRLRLAAARKAAA